jgi:hypothetical protein
MDEERRMPSAYAGQERAISRLRDHVAALVEGRWVDQEIVQDEIDSLFGPDGPSISGRLKTEFEAAELALRICVEVGAPRSSMRAHQQECDRVLDALVHAERS